MSLESPTLFERVTAWPHFKLVVLIAGLIAVIGFGLFVVDRCDSYSAKRKDQAAKDKIANTAKEIANISNVISNLEVQKAEKRGELNRDMEQLQDNLFGLEEKKAETNAALANFQRAVNSNSNVNRSAEDLEEVLRRLDQ